jgi:hypothetical protein
MAVQVPEGAGWHPATAANNDSIAGRDRTRAKNLAALAAGPAGTYNLADHDDGVTWRPLGPTASMSTLSTPPFPPRPPAHRPPSIWPSSSDTNVSPKPTWSCRVAAADPHRSGVFLSREIEVGAAGCEPLFSADGPNVHESTSGDWSDLWMDMGCFALFWYSVSHLLIYAYEIRCCSPFRSTSRKTRWILDLVASGKGACFARTRPNRPRRTPARPIRACRARILRLRPNRTNLHE